MLAGWRRWRTGGAGTAASAGASALSRVGIVGVGLMGGAMALRLLDSGHAVAVCDIDAARVQLAAAAGAAAAATPAALAPCEIVIVAVVDGAHTREVLFRLDGLARALPVGATVLLCPIIGPADTASFAVALAERGVGCIDAPMSGGPARARDGTMSLMVACPAPLFERWQPLLQTLASRLFRVGERAGDGARTELVNNLLVAVNLAGAAEALALAGWPAGPGPRGHAGRDRRVERSELDRLRPPAPCAGWRRCAARAHGAAGQGFGARDRCCANGRSGVACR